MVCVGWGTASAKLTQAASSSVVEALAAYVVAVEVAGIGRQYDREVTGCLCDGVGAAATAATSCVLKSSTDSSSRSSEHQSTSVEPTNKQANKQTNQQQAQKCAAERVRGSLRTAESSEQVNAGRYSYPSAVIGTLHVPITYDGTECKASGR